MSKTQTCKERISSHLTDRIKDLRKIWRLEREGKVDPELGAFHEYGLSFDYVSKGTFANQKEGYFRYQLSWGGPSDEFRFFTDSEMNLTRIEYWFLDWFDGAHKKLSGSRYALLEEIYTDFYDTGICKEEFQKAGITW